jgi:DNA-directed RNA polymerase specialized sigma24 family protein
MARLPAKQRRAIYLRLVDGMAYREVASALGSTEAAVRNSIYRGLKLLRAMLGEAERYLTETPG